MILIIDTPGAELLEEALSEEENLTCARRIRSDRASDRLIADLYRREVEAV
jgi:hypothetical protein